MPGMPSSGKQKGGMGRGVDGAGASGNLPAAAAVLPVVTALLLAAAVAAGKQPAAGGIRPEELGSLLALMKPRADEWGWMQVPWMPSSDLWAARCRAAREGKPIFLWYMAGEPLGRC